MTSFVTTDYPREHPGVARAEAVVSAFAEAAKTFDSAKTLATLLSAAVVAALVVVADRVIDSWADGHLLATWVIMWAVAFAALGFFAPLLKQVFSNLNASYQAWALRSQNAQAEEAYWQSALNDPRVMADYQAAKMRSEPAGSDQAGTTAQAETSAAQVAGVSIAAMQRLSINPTDLGATLERVTNELSPSKRYLRYV